LSSNLHARLVSALIETVNVFSAQFFTGQLIEFNIKPKAQGFRPVSIGAFVSVPEGNEL
jgi:hypothetical protein